VGIGRLDTSLEQQLKTALKKGNIEAIAESSAALSRRAIANRELDGYLERFTPFIREKLSRRIPLDDPRKEVRAEWSRLKREYNIRIRAVLSQAVEQAVIDFLRTRLKA
jgi:hypothetical protein